MQFGFEGSIAQTLCGRQRLVEGRNSPVDVARAGIGLGQRDFHEPIEIPDVVLMQALGPAAHVLESAEQVAFDPRPSLEKCSESARLSKIVFARNSDELQRVFRQGSLAAAHQCELGGKHFSECERIGVGKARDPRFHPIDKRNCAIDLAEGPTSKRQIRHGGDAGVWPEAKRHFVIAPWLEQRERVFETLACFAIFSGEPVSDALKPMPDAGFGELGLASTSARKVLA